MANLTVFELPILTPYPSRSIQERLRKEENWKEWNTCLDLWIKSIEPRLVLSSDQLAKYPIEVIGLPFLLSYFSRHDVATRHEFDDREKEFDKVCYALTRKFLSVRNDGISPFMYFELLSGGSIAFNAKKSWKTAVKAMWSSRPVLVRKAVEAAKSALAASSTPEARMSCLNKISALTKASPETAVVTSAGADYLDIMTDLYSTGSVEVQRTVTANVFYSARALLENKRITMLTDNIYHMKSQADQSKRVTPEAQTLLSSLLCTTIFLQHFRANNEVASRKQALVDQLDSYRQDMLHLHPLPPKPKQKKGKERMKGGQDMHMHKAAEISQIRDIFPNLSVNYVLKALDYYRNDVQNTVTALSDPDALPKELRDSIATDHDEPSSIEIPVDLAPRSTPPLLPERRSVFDNDDFDQLNISLEHLRRGKKNIDLNDPMDRNGHNRTKAAIMSALAAFDSDDDERDDTYDVADIGGAVDNTVDTDERRQPKNDATEAALYTSWKQNPELFSRDSKTRASSIRQQLKRETGMDDEQLEGWAIMLSRDSKLQDRLQDKYSAARAFSGQQKSIESTRWQANTSTDNSETESGPERSNDSRRIGQAGIRGHRNFGRGRGRGGGDTFGPADDAATQAARKRKEQGRGRGGANNRRDARAKKVGRGMGPLPPS